MKQMAAPAYCTMPLDVLQAQDLLHELSSGDFKVSDSSAEGCHLRRQLIGDKMSLAAGIPRVHPPPLELNIYATLVLGPPPSPTPTLLITCSYDEIKSNELKIKISHAHPLILSHTHTITHTHSSSLVLIAVMTPKELKTKILMLTL